MEINKYEVPLEKLRWQCDPSLFEFECTKDLAPLREFIGQERAVRAVEFGLNMANDGYNIYVSGLAGTGKTSMVKTYIERLIAEKQSQGEEFTLHDWCYLYNFKEPDYPQIWNNIGICYHMMEDYDNALVYYRKASDYSPKDVFPLINSGICLEELGKEEDAIRFYKAALAVDPDNEKAKAELLRFGE